MKTLKKLCSEMVYLTVRHRAKLISAAGPLTALLYSKASSLAPIKMGQKPSYWYKRICSSLMAAVGFKGGRTSHYVKRALEDFPFK